MTDTDDRTVLEARAAARLMHPMPPPMPARKGSTVNETAETGVEVNAVCCDNMQPRLDDDADDPTVWAIVCDSCGTDLAFIIDRTG